MDAVPGTPLYSRVDIIEAEPGKCVLGELELMEPTLFLWHSAGAAARFSHAIQRELLNSGHDSLDG